MISRYLGLIGLIVFAVYLRRRYLRQGKESVRDATTVNLNFLLGAAVALFVIRIVFDLVRIANDPSFP